MSAEDNTPIALPPDLEKSNPSRKPSPKWIVLAVLVIGGLFAVWIIANSSSATSLLRSLSPKPNMTATLDAWVRPAQPPTLGSAAEAQLAHESNSAESLDNMVLRFPDLPEVSQPGDVYSFEAILQTSVPILWSFHWCATTQEILDQIWTQMRIELILNETPVLESQIFSEDFQSGDNFCRFLTALITYWPVGQHHLEVRVTFIKPTDDGWVLNPAGTHIWKYIVTSLTVTNTSTPAVTSTKVPTSTITPTKDPFLTPSITPTPVISARDGMTLLFVPAGKFIMGSSDSDPFADSSEKPQHSVWLSAFWIDQTEVTNAMYALCVQDRNCQPPGFTSSNTRRSYNGYYGNDQYDNYPVIYVNWDQADAYCKWAGGNLPSEAQWEKAARGADGRIWPWGNDDPNDNLLNSNDYVGDTTRVGMYPRGASIYGALDMAGNVWEWVADWYDPNYYSSSPLSNPLGPSSDGGGYKILRGGSWYLFWRAAARFTQDPQNQGPDIGFRCAHGTPR